MIGETSGPRFIEATEGDKLNIEILFKEAMQSWVKWPNNALADIYTQLF